MIISFILVTLMFDPGEYCKEKLDASHSQGLKRGEGGGGQPHKLDKFWSSKARQEIFSDHYLREIWFLP